MIDNRTSALQFQHDVPLAPMTTIGLGGPARLFIECRSLDELRAALDEARRQGLPVQVLGGGSNLIFPDRGFNGLVLRVALGGIEWSEEEEEEGGGFVLARVRAGEWWDGFVRQTVERGLAGVECLSGIPGSTGAVPIQNVGAYGQEVTETITEVRALNRHSGQERTFTNAECEFAYRMSRFKEREKNEWIVTEVVFRLLKHRRAPGAVYPELKRHLEAQAALQSDEARLRVQLNADGTLPEQFSSEEEARSALHFIRDSVLALRKKKSMVVDPADPDTRSVGSFFMNPIVTPQEFARISGKWNAAHPEAPMPSFASGAKTKIPAAWLIERAGFPKGYRRGGVGISSHHTLALVNYGGTTDELFALAAEIQRGVEASFGIRLEREAIAVE